MKPPHPLPGPRILRGILLAWAGLDAGARGHPPLGPLPLNPPESSGLWQPFLSVRAGGGYRSNPLLGHDAEGSGFATTGVDLLLLRLPTGNTTFTAFFSGDDIRYFRTLRTVTNEPGATQEQTFLSAVRFGHGLGSTTNWVLKLEARHLYNDQFLNTSSFDAFSTNLSSLRAVTHLGSVLPSVARRGGGWELELGGVATRQAYVDAEVDTGLSSTWELGPRAAARWRSPRIGDLDAELTGIHREFDDRPQSSTLGLPLAGTRLRQDDLRAEVLWRRDWDEARHWQTTLRAFHVWRRENGEGYTDYDRLGVAATVRHAAGPWTLQATGRWSTYDYPHSYVVFGGVVAVPRERESVQAEARAQYALAHATHLYLEYQLDRELANRTSDTYVAHGFTLGLEHDF